ncbi:MAG TPA: ABC transporter permease [Bryobacteraceae bacterium]|nr:ABC transporter permease [Bryobacteraceae bacterium]
MFASLKSLWRRIAQRGRWEREMDEELRFHIDARTASLMKTGMPEQQARRQALVEFGGVEAHKELCRETSWFARVADECTRNLRYAVRSLAKSPGYTAVGVISLALGIGANVATFSLVERLMLTTLPVRDPETLFQVGRIKADGFENSHSYPNFENLRSHKDLFEEVLAWCLWTHEVTANEHLEESLVAYVSGSYFPMLGVHASLGRELTERDDHPGVANVAMIGHSAWQRFYGGSAEVVGQIIKVGGVPFQVVGVAPVGFYGVEIGDAPDVIVPLHGYLAFNKNAISGEGLMWLHAMVRLKPGVSLAAARSIFRDRGIEAAKAKRAERGRLDLDTGPTIEDASRGYSDVRKEFSHALVVLMALVGMVLLIACANLSTLLFVRGAGRSGEMSLRLALGASRGQLIRQWMTESLLIALAGGISGMLLAGWVVDLLLVFVQEKIRQYLRFQTDWKILVFALAVTLATGLLFGLLPAVRASNTSPGVRLKEAQPSILGRRRRLARGVLALQVAASLVLLTSAGLFARTLWKLNTRTGGFARSEIVYANVKLQSGKEALLDDVMERLKQSPLLAAVSRGRVPLSNARGWSSVKVPGYTPSPLDNNLVYHAQVTPGYFRALGVAMLEGRDFEEKDRAWPARVIIVSESFAKHYFQNRSPIGSKVNVFYRGPAVEIVGVARDVKYGALRESLCDVAYYPVWSGPIIARPKRPEDRAAALTEIRAAVAAVAKDARVSTGTLEEMIQRSLRRDRLVAQLSAVLGLLGVVLAAIGLYGVIAHDVASRVREIGIRIALGASQWSIMQATLTEVAVVIGLGMLAGIPACMGGARLIQSLLFETSPTDPVTFAAAAAILAMSALLAAFWPARRAWRLDPAQSLRHE